MTNIFVIAEHRDGQIRGVTFELLRKAIELREETGAEVSTVLLGHQVDDLVKELSFHKTDEVVVIEDKGLESYSCDGYQKALLDLIMERKPLLTMVGHTAYGIDFVPSLAIRLDLPLVTDCIDLRFEGGDLVATRQMYGGKMNVEVRFPKANRYLTTVRPTRFQPIEEDRTRQARVIYFDLKLRDEDIRSKTLELIKPPIEDVDITKADIIVAVGRGIGGKENLPLVESLVDAIGGVLAASRPVIDMGLLPVGRQVGVSGKTVKPKLYIAIGISGSIQHMMGMKGSKIVLAINKDPKAPIFDLADYGVVDDLFAVVPPLTELLKKK